MIWLNTNKEYARCKHKTEAEIIKVLKLDLDTGINFKVVVRPLSLDTVF